MRRRLAVGLSIPVVILFIGIMMVLLAPSNVFVLTESLDRLSLLGSRDRIEGLAPPGTQATDLWLVGGRLWDAEGGVRPNPGLGVTGGRISFEKNPGARTIDLDGRTLLPGLIDMHVHALGGAFDGEMMIAAGVTTARDLGSYLPGVLHHRESSETGERIGPRLLVTGPYLVGGVGGTDQEIGVMGPEDAASAVAQLAAEGVDGIKLHHDIDGAMMSAVVAVAHRRGLWVAAHLDLVTPAEAAAAGVDSIEHAAGIEAGALEETVRILIEHDVAVTPTIGIAVQSIRLADRENRDDPTLAYFPTLFRRFWVRNQLANARAAKPLDDADRRRRLERLETVVRFTRLFHEAGGRILAGSDAPAFLRPPGYALQREIELLVTRAGIPPADALAAATRDAASELGLESEIGSLQQGMLADLLVVRGDPLADISRIQDVVLVISAGRVLLDRAD